jgi:hypothetical protein
VLPNILINMKKSIVFGLLLFPFFIFAQDGLNFFVAKPKLNTASVINSTSFQFKGQKFILSPLKFIPEAEFTVYNKTTQLNDFYYVKKDTFYYQKSAFIPENHMFQPKLDSFNPSGASDLGSAVIIGIINTVFGKF